MLASLARVLRDRDGSVRGRVIGMYAFLFAANVIVWGLTLGAAIHYPVLLASGVLAYSFGLRHAVDADHISAIDNVTRKLMQENKRPVAVGFFFSLGHSTIVVLLTVAIAFAANLVNKDLPGFKSTGALIGTSVSALFLYVIAALNLVILIGIFKLFRHVTRGGAYSQDSLDDFLAQRGLMGRFFRPLFRLINHSWHMYPVGVLFGLGFDTATEVGVISLGALAAANGMPIYYVLLLPLLFTAGMSLADTTDGILMLGAYGWAFVKPVRKLYYNLNITLISVLVALVVGTIEVLQIVSGELNLGGPFWDFVNNTLSLGNLGFYIVGIFLVAWLASTLVYRVKRYEDLEGPRSPGPTPAGEAA